MEQRPSDTSPLLAELEDLRRRISDMEMVEAERNRVWETVQEREEQYRAAVENVADAIVINVGTTRVFVNNAFLTLHGLDDMSQASGLSLDHFIITEDRPTVRARTLARERGEPAPGVYEYRIRRTTGKSAPLSPPLWPSTFNGEPATLAVLRDITERKQAEDRVRRLAAIGRIITSSLNVEEVYEPFAQQVRELIASERIVITIAAPEQDVFTTAYVSGGDVARRRERGCCRPGQFLDPGGDPAQGRAAHPAHGHQRPPSAVYRTASRLRSRVPFLPLGASYVPRPGDRGAPSGVHPNPTLTPTATWTWPRAWAHRYRER